MDNNPRFIDNGDGTIIDTTTGLMWQRGNDGETRLWDEAGQYANDLKLAGHSDWRLPTIKELVWLVDYEKSNPAIDSIFNCLSSGYWSGTTSAGDTDSAWFVIFGYGYVIPLFIWIMTGVFVGLFSKSVKKAALLTLLGLLIQILLFTLLTTVDPSFIPAFLQNPENAALLGGFTTEFFITLGLFLCWYALTLPGGMIGSIMGGLVSRSAVQE